MTARLPLHALQLSPSGNLIAAACANIFQLIDVKSGKLVATTKTEDAHAPGSMVRNIVWHKDTKIVSSAEDKLVKEWHVSQDEAGQVQLSLVEQREIVKRANCLCISEDGKTLVVADKFGDVYAYPMFGCESDLPDPPAPAIEAEASKAAAPITDKTPMYKQYGIQKGNMKQPEWRHVPARVSETAPLLGHVSMITCMLVLDSRNRIITADRDEHVRVSKWPKGWQIERFLMGHRAFVSVIGLHPSDPNILITAGGDDVARLWNTTTMTTEAVISLAALKGHAEVQVQLERSEYGKVKRRRHHRKVLRAEKLKKAKLDEPKEQQDDANGDEDESEGQDPPDQVNRPSTKIKKLELGIRKIVHLGSPETGLTIFSSIGSSALLAYPTRALLAGPRGDGKSEEPRLILLDTPVLDIAANAHASLLWVSKSIAEIDSASADAQFVQVMQVDASGKLVLCEHSTGSTLNACALATSAETPYPNTMTLYPDIALLSKDPYGDRIGGGQNDFDNGE